MKINYLKTWIGLAFLASISCQMTSARAAHFYFENTAVDSSVQDMLDNGDSPLQLFRRYDIPLDSFYGKSYAGGRIISFDTSTGEGIVAALEDIQEAQWGCNGTQIGTGTNIGSGLSNSKNIINQCGDQGIAARICLNLTMAGYSDWFLPSKDEIQLMNTYMQKLGVGNFVWAQYYWTSSQWGWSGSIAWAYRISDDVWNQYTKNSTLRVRPVRSFAEPTLPSAGITSVMYTGKTQFTVLSSISGNGGARIQQKGFRIGTSAALSDKDTFIFDLENRQDSIYATDYNASMNTLYYVRSFVRNTVGYSYGPVKKLATYVSVGDTYAGGIVAYIYQSGDSGYDATSLVKHGIVAADTSIRMDRWAYDSCTTAEPANDTIIGSGAANTINAYNSCDWNPTAYTVMFSCHNWGYFHKSPYSDWAIPSKQELNKMFESRFQVGGYKNGMYWSSSINNWQTKRVWAQSFYYDIDAAGYQEPRDMNYPITYMRVVRYF